MVDQQLATERNGYRHWAIGTPLIAKVQLRDVSLNEQKANAQRIVACVNACKGFSLEELQGANLFADSIESDSEIIALKKQRDELLDALEDLLECPYHIDEATVSKAGLEATMNANPHQVVGNMSVALARVRKARAAIANARGES